MDFLGGPVAKNQPGNAGGMGPVHLEPMLCGQRSHCNEKLMYHLPQLEKAHVQQQRASAARNKNK